MPLGIGAEIFVLRIDDDARARLAAIVDRCDTIPDEIFERLHGAVRSLRPADDVVEPESEVPWWDPAADASVDPWRDAITIGAVSVAKGSRVRLRPARGGGRGLS